MTWDPEDTRIADPATWTIRVCALLCTTCVYRPGNLMHLEPGRVRDMTEEAVANEGHVVCHKTIGTANPAICAGFARHPVGSRRSLALRMIAAGIAQADLITPPGSEKEEEEIRDPPRPENPGAGA